MIAVEYQSTKRSRRICAPFSEAYLNIHTTEGSANSAHSDKGVFFAPLFRKCAIQSTTISNILMNE